MSWPGKDALLAEVRKGWPCPSCTRPMTETSRSSQFIPEPPQLWVRFWCEGCGIGKEIAYADDHLDEAVRVWPRDNSSKLRTIPYKP